MELIRRAERTARPTICTSDVQRMQVQFEMPRKSLQPKYALFHLQIAAHAKRQLASGLNRALR